MPWVALLKEEILPGSLPPSGSVPSEVSEAAPWKGICAAPSRGARGGERDP